MSDRRTRDPVFSAPVDLGALRWDVAAMSGAEARSEKSDRRSAAKISLIYLVVAIAWILLSDTAIHAIIPPEEVEKQHWFQTIKGLTFVFITTLLLWLLVVQRLRQVRAAEAEMRRSQERFDAFADNFPGVVYLKDHEGRYVLVRGQPMPDGTPLSTLLGRTDKELFEPELADRVVAQDRVVYDQGENSQIIESTEFGDGHQHWLVQRFPLNEPGGRRWLGGLALDVTERQQALTKIRSLVAELEEANRMKDQFLSNLSHELRTPITAIRLWTEVLRTSKPDDHETLREAAAMIRHSAVTQTLLIEDLLDVTRIISGRLKVEMKPMRLAEVVRRTAELLQPMATERLVKLVTEIPDDPCAMVGDARRVQQVVWNLLTNALKFSHANGEVRCALTREGDFWAITVSDRGVGLRADQLPHVFERFKQPVSTRVRPEAGVGIGLSIVKHMVEAHGGSVSAASEGEGKGATFVARFPVSSEPVPAAGTPKVARPRSKPLANKRLLLVEDNADSRTGLTLLLNRAGAQVVPCENADQALAAPEPFDLLLSDIGLPDRDGCDLITELRKRPEWADRPALALSAFVMPEDKDRARRAGFDDFIVKPVDAEELIRLLAARLANPGRTATAGAASEPQSGNEIPT